MELNGKNAVVVGGLGGIGIAICIEFLKRQIQNLAILDKNEDRGLIKTLSKKYPSTNIIFIPFNITDKKNIDQSFEKIIKEFKCIDILVNSAGITDETRPELVTDVNLTGCVLTTLKAVQLMSKDKGGRGGLIVNIASALGLDPAFTHAAYTASKHGVVGFTRSMSSDIYYEHTGINFNTICPGKTETVLVKHFRENSTLEYGMPHIKKFADIKAQTTEECAMCIVTAMEQNKIGAVWMIEQAKLTEITFPKYWNPEAL